jgi:hypothetical protein
VTRLIDAAELPFYRILLMTLDGTGARLFADDGKAVSASSI